jgi:hypothetical protein
LIEALPRLRRIAALSGSNRTAGSEGAMVTVGLHGDDTVSEEARDPLNNDGSATMRVLRAANSDMFKPHHYAYKEHDLHLEIAAAALAQRAPFKSI